MVVSDTFDIYLHLRDAQTTQFNQNMHYQSEQMSVFIFFICSWNDRKIASKQVSVFEETFQC